MEIELTPEELREKAFFDKVRQDAEIFFVEFLGVKRLEDYHKNILHKFIQYNRIAIAATHAVGKTWITARIVLFFLFMFKNSKVITTAPTNRQVKKLLWGELRAAHRKAIRPLGGRMLQTELIVNEEWYAMGFAPQKDAGDGREQSGSSFQGFHADAILIVFDEATGIPADVWKMAEGLLTSGAIVKFICIGNPTTRNSEFFKCFSSAEWCKIYLSCFDSPNMIANGFTDMGSLMAEVNLLKTMTDEEKLTRLASYKCPVTYLLSASWVLGRALAWGVDHPLFLSKCLGTFPREEDNVIVQLGEVEASQRRENITMPGMVRSVGVDVARFGEDSTVFTEIVGDKQTRIKKMGKLDNVEVVNELVPWLLEKHGSTVDYETVISIDGTGVGGGVIDILKHRQREAGSGVPTQWEILEVHFGASVETEADKEALEETKEQEKKYKLRYANLKAKMFNQLGKDIRENLQLLEENIYLEQLPTIKYKFDSKGRMQIESKDEYKIRTGLNSPDESDSLALANYGRHERKPVGTFASPQENLTKSAYRPDTRSSQEQRIKRRFNY